MREWRNAPLVDSMIKAAQRDRLSPIDAGAAPSPPPDQAAALGGGKDPAEVANGGGETPNGDVPIVSGEAPISGGEAQAGGGGRDRRGGGHHLAMVMAHFEKVMRHLAMVTGNIAKVMHHHAMVMGKFAKVMRHHAVVTGNIAKVMDHLGVVMAPFEKVMRHLAVVMTGGAGLGRAFGGLDRSSQVQAGKRSPLREGWILRRFNLRGSWSCKDGGSRYRPKMHCHTALGSGRCSQSARRICAWGDSGPFCLKTCGSTSLPSSLISCRCPWG